jgi:TolB-like protein
MKKTAVPVLLTILILSFPHVLDAKKRIKVGVAAFSSKNVSVSTAQTVTDLVRNELSRYKNFDVLDRDNMKRLLKEQSLQQTGVTDSSTAVKMGRILNLRYMIFGAVSRLNRKFIITAEMVDIETSRIVVSVKRVYYNIDYSDSAVKSLVREIVYRRGPKRVKISSLKDVKAIKQALKKKYTSRKSKYYKHRILGSISSYDGIVEKPYVFMVIETTRMPSRRKAVRIVSNMFVTTIMRKSYVYRKVQRAYREGKPYVVYGFRIKPKNGDNRLVENRIYHRNGKVQYLEIILVTRDKNWKAKKAKKIRIKLPF